MRLKITLVLLSVVLLIMVGFLSVNAAEPWTPNTYYTVGVIVTYSGNDYKCIQAHTAIVGWEPPNVPALWQLIGPSGSSLPGSTPTVTKTPTATRTPSGASPTATKTPTAPRTPTATKTPTTTPTIAINVSLQSDWGTGATKSATIINNTANPINGWTLEWTFASSNQTITDMSGGSFTQNGTLVTVSNAPDNGIIAANGGTASFSFNMNYSSSNDKPFGFKFNGVDLSSWYVIWICKPNIYLYPPQKQDVTVKLSLTGSITASYPTYNPQIGGWQVTAFPDGKIINKADRKEYSYLFWEGLSAHTKYDLSKGFVVAGKDTMNFLQDTLAKMGLTPKEYNEFIVYWLPQMQENKYNLITFAGKEYTDIAKLEITPQPDAVLRVFMIFKPLEERIEIKAQEIKPFVRKGFTVVEWGGAQLQ